MPVLAMLATLVLAGCLSARQTTRLAPKSFPSPNGDGPGYRFENIGGGKEENKLFVCLAFSGGGTRAAALAYGAMIALKQTRIEWPRHESLLDDVDVISSVSGGSFTAAYYGLFREHTFPDPAQQSPDFERNFLYRNIEGSLILQALAPWYWPWLLSPYYSRIDLAADYYGNTVFDNRTFESMKKLGRPFIILNATNIGNETRFPFTQEQFDVIGSDLSDYPVARAVAASSAFPFLLSPLELENYQRLDGFPKLLQYELGMRDYYENPSHYYWSQTQQDYISNHKPYVHLLDGGLADNIGLRPIINAYQQSNGFLLRHISDIDRLVIISVNARSKSDDMTSEQHHTPHIIPTVAEATAEIAMDNYSFDTEFLMKELIDQLEQDKEELARGPHQTQLHVVPYTVEVSFEAIANEDRRKKFYGVGTNFDLPAEQVQALISEGCNLLKNDARYRCMLQDIENEATTGKAPEQSACKHLEKVYRPKAAEDIQCPKAGRWEG